MSTSSWIIVVIIAFFALVVHAIHLEDRRKGDRRKQALPHAVERRKANRRKGSFAAKAAWVVRAGLVRRKP